MQFSSSRRLRDLLLVAATLVLAVTSLGVTAVPAALGLGAGKYFSSAELWSQVAVGGLLAGAALTPRDRPIVRSAHPAAITGVLCLCALAITGLGSVFSGWQSAPATSNLAHAMPRPVLFVVVLGATLPPAYAARAFMRWRREEADRMVILLAAAALLLAGASLSDLVTRSLAPERIGADAALRIVAYSLILSAALVLECRVRGRLASNAALAERRRVARDLHDGLAQDLAVIAALGPSIAQEVGDGHPVVVAARRALAISRSTISELTDPDGTSAHESLEAVAQELRDRFALTIAVDTQLQVDLQPRAREHVTRIAREAIVNAARHGRAQNVVVSLTHVEGGVALRVVDDGCGITQAHGRTQPTTGPSRPAQHARAGSCSRWPYARRTSRTGWDRVGGRASVSRQPRLLIADREATRVGIRLALEGEVEICAEADHTEQAIRAAKRQQPDICIVSDDLQGSGLAAVRGMSRAAPAASVVVLCQRDDVDLLLDYVRAGAVGYLPGSLDAQRLRRVVRAVAANEAVVPRSMVLELVRAIHDRGNGAGALTGRESQVLGMLRRGHSTAESRIGSKSPRSPCEDTSPT